MHADHLPAGPWPLRASRSGSTTCSRRGSPPEEAPRPRARKSSFLTSASSMTASIIRSAGTSSSTTCHPRRGPLPRSAPPFSASFARLRLHGLERALDRARHASWSETSAPGRGDDLGDPAAHLARPDDENVRKGSHGAGKYLRLGARLEGALGLARPEPGRHPASAQVKTSAEDEKPITILIRHRAARHPRPRARPLRRCCRPCPALASRPTGEQTARWGRPPRRRRSQSVCASRTRSRGPPEIRPLHAARPRTEQALRRDRRAS